MSVPPPFPGQHATIDSVARTVVSRIAPEEIPYYPRVRDEYFARGRASRANDNPLGFGEVIIGVVTGIVLTVLHDLVVESLTDAARPWWKRAWRQLTGLLRIRPRPQVGPGTGLRALGPEEVPAIIAAITEHAVRANLPPNHAAQLADAIVAELVSAPPSEDARAGSED